MRITHLTASGELGGAERVALECVQVAKASPGLQSSLISLGDGPVLEAGRALGARTSSVETPPDLAGLGDVFSTTGAVARAMLPALVGFPGFYRRYSDAVADSEPDVIHSHGIKTHVLSALLPRRAPLVWHLHDHVSARSASSKLLRLLAHRCALAIAVSESVAADARRVLPASLPIVVVHNAIDVDRFVADGPALDLDSLSGLPAAAAGTIRIGMPATFARWKGQDIFLDAVARLAQPGVRAYIIGDALYETRNSQWSRAELQSAIQRLGISGRVGLTGIVEDMPAAYRALDIVVHASTRPEPFGLVIAEAMACGRALIAAPAGGAGELFVDGVHALAVHGGDAPGLAAAIERLISDPLRRKTLGAAAREHAAQSFSRERFGRELRAALNRVAMGALALAVAQ